MQVGAGAHVQWGAPQNRYNSSVFTGEFNYDLQSFFDGRLTLFSSLSLGYTHYFYSARYEEAVETYISDGLYFNPRIGYRINFFKNIGVTIGLGYQYVGGTKRRVSNGEKIKNMNLSSLSVNTSIFF